LASHLRLRTDADTGDATPAVNAPAFTWQPPNTWRPGPQGGSYDPAADALSRIEHIQRSVSNIKALLGIENPHSDGRAA